jgi:hypothetical protein
MKITFTIDMPEEGFYKILESDKKGDKFDLTDLLKGKKGFVNSWEKNIKTTLIDEMPGTLKEYVDAGSVHIFIVEDETDGK